MRLQDWRQVLEVPGFVRLVGLGRQPCPLPETDIIKMREALSAGLLAEPYPYLNVGTRVEIRNGPLQGITGILLRRGNSHRLVISIELIMRSIVVEVDASDVVSVRRHASHRPDVYVRGSSTTSRWRAGGSATICSPNASAQVSDEPPDPSHL